MMMMTRRESGGKTMVSLALAPIAVLSSGRRRRRGRLSCKNFQRRAASPSDVRLMETPLFCPCPFLSFVRGILKEEGEEEYAAHSFPPLPTLS